jgi:amidohydrolase
MNWAMNRVLLAMFLVAGLVACGETETESAPQSDRESGTFPATDVLDEDMLAMIDQLNPQVIEWRRHFHEFPELSNREFDTAEKIAAHLEALGMEVQTGVAHTGVVGILRGEREGPVVGLRADMDALPVPSRVDLPFSPSVTGEFNGEEVPVSHACGHDAHMAILMGVAEVLSAHRDRLPGTVKFIFQPAEEGPPEGEEGGAEMMVKEGVLKNPDVDAVFALHIISTQELGTIELREGGMWASVDDFRITVKGKQSHGAYPWQSVDPIVTSAQIINSLQTVVSRNHNVVDHPAVVTIGRIRGGVRSNIIPEEVEMIGTLRALDPEARLHLIDRVRTIAEKTAESMGATAEVELPMSVHYPVTMNDPALTAGMRPVLESVIGAENVREAQAVTGAEDFSFFSQEVPGLYLRLGGRPADVSREEAPDHHTPEFHIDDSRLDVGVRAMTAMALAYLRGESD